MPVYISQISIQFDNIWKNQFYVYFSYKNTCFIIYIIHVEAGILGLVPKEVGEIGSLIL